MGCYGLPNRDSFTAACTMAAHLMCSSISSFISFRCADVQVDRRGPAERSGPITYWRLWACILVQHQTEIQCQVLIRTSSCFVILYHAGPATSDSLLAMTAALQLLQQHPAHSFNVTKQMQQGNLNATQKLARSNTNQPAEVKLHILVVWCQTRWTLYSTPNNCA
jgi:hypothetical protein